MNVIGAWLGKLFAATGGAPAAGALIVAGVVVGGLLGAGAGGAFSQNVPIPGALPMYPCPEMGPPLTQVPSGQHMLVTGRSADGAWLRIHFGGPGRSEAWVPASAIRLEMPADSLPVAGCGPEVALAGNVSPGPTLTTIGSFEPTPSPTPSPTPPPTPMPKPTPTATPRVTPRPATPRPPTPTPTPPPDTTRPVVTAPVPKPVTFYDVDSVFCAPGLTSTTVNATAEDPESGIARVTLYWRNLQTQSQASKRMALVSGSAKNFQVVLDSVALGIENGDYSIWIRAINGEDLGRDSGTSRFIVQDCS